MNVLLLKCEYKLYFKYRIESFSCIIDDCTVNFYTENIYLFIKIEGCINSVELINLLSDIESLLFIYFGSFFKELSILINGCEQDLSDKVDKYQTNSNFKNINLVLCCINAQTVNKSIVSKLRELNQYPLYSLQYLVSENYKSVITDHKITLLLHVVEGMVDKKDPREVIDYFGIQPNEKLGGYFASAYHLCKSFFFKYDEKYEAEILPLLIDADIKESSKDKELKFIKSMVDTRHWYSHFLNTSEKQSRLKEGDEMLIYFEIIYYALRLLVIKELGLELDEGKIKEFYYTVHDWILKVLYNKDEPLKSITYHLGKEWESFMDGINNLNSNTNPSQRE